MEARRAVAFGHPAKPGAKNGIGERRFDQTFEQSPEVHPRAAHDHGDVSSPADGGDRGVGVANVVGQRIGDPGVGDVHEPVRNKKPLGGLRLRGRRVEPPVNLKGVAAHDLATDPRCHLDRERGFSRPRRAGDDQNRYRVLGLGIVRLRASSRPAFTVSWR